MRMAVSRVAAARRLCHRYQMFIYIALLLISIQLMLALSFYTGNLEEIQKFDDWKRRVERLEQVHADAVVVDGVGWLAPPCHTSFVHSPFSCGLLRQLQLGGFNCTVARRVASVFVSKLSSTGMADSEQLTVKVADSVSDSE